MTTRALERDSGGRAARSSKGRTWTTGRPASCRRAAARPRRLRRSARPKAIAPAAGEPRSGRACARSRVCRGGRRVAGGVALWALVYHLLAAVRRLAVPRRAAACPTPAGPPPLEFFVYDSVKVLLLLTLVVFGVGIVRSFFSPQRTRALLRGRRETTGNVMAAEPRHRHPLLQLLGRAAVHRLRRGRHPARASPSRS